MIGGTTSQRGVEVVLWSRCNLEILGDDDGSALQRATEARAPRKKQHQLDEDALPLMQKLTE